MALSRVKVVHHDIAPGNIFYRGNEWLLGDFGQAIDMAEPDALLSETEMGLLPSNVKRRLGGSYGFKDP